jgi:hypothetical protein
MPAQRLGNLATSLSKYDVVAQDADSHASFIRHVGLADQDRSRVSLNASVDVAHMGPPLERIQGRFAVHACGSAGLSASDIRQISVFVDEHLSEYEAEKVRGKRQYVIVPHCREPDESCSVRRFNCAGFVIEAYRYAGIDLLTTDAPSLPQISLEDLFRTYPDREGQLRHPKLREKFGLEGDGPWPVVMAGYVMNSLDRPAEEIRARPYTPKEGDAFFPPSAAQGYVRA